MRMSFFQELYYSLCTISYRTVNSENILLYKRERKVPPHEPKSWMWVWFSLLSLPRKSSVDLPIRKPWQDGSLPVWYQRLCKSSRPEWGNQWLLVARDRARPHPSDPLWPRACPRVGGPRGHPQVNNSLSLPRAITGSTGCAKTSLRY